MREDAIDCFEHIRLRKKRSKPGPFLSKRVAALLWVALNLTPCLTANASADADIDWDLSGVLRTRAAQHLHSPGDISQFLWTLDLFANLDLSETTSVHLQPRLYYDAIWDFPFENDPYGARVGEHKNLRNRYGGPRIGTTADPLREAYIDYFGESLNLRIGKQQVVWGTADGIRLLDIVNPSDFRDFYQSSMEDLRVTLWMAKAELALDHQTTLQGIWIPDIRANQFPGLTREGDQGHPFVFKGIDAITGDIWGLTQLSPRLGDLSEGFNQSLGFPDPSFFREDTVHSTGVLSPGVGLNPFVEEAIRDLGLPSEEYNLALLSAGDGRQNSMFEFMPSATMETILNYGNVSSDYRRKYPSSFRDGNFGIRWKGSRRNITYSVNYYYHWGNNPAVEFSYEASGRRVVPIVEKGANGSGAPISITGFTDSDGRIYSGALGHPSNDGDPQKVDQIVLVATEKLYRVHSIGGSMDITVSTDFGPVVMRGEFLYDRGERTPVLDQGILGTGDLANGLKMESADFFRYALGVDKSILNNIYASIQFIQFVNLDYIDALTRGRDILGDPLIDSVTGEAFTLQSVDFPTMNLRNGFRQARKYKSFWSLHLTKDFYYDQLRLSNLLLYSNDGGYWDRLILEYQYDDRWRFSAESNLYFGNEDDVLGQFRDSSSFRIAVSYAF